MKSVLRRIVERMGARGDAPRHRLQSELELADELGIAVEDVRIAVQMMRAQGLLEPRVEGGEPGLALSEEGLREYRAYRGEEPA
ncbi:MAG: hypothetical protein SCH98_13390 [Deferrisomatales bacterium]|nr:hypothetical protein [Deferrisomatales bacterium]